jgi:hypothetical protein
MLTGLDHEEPSQVRALPLPSTATQKLAEAHDTEVNAGLLPKGGSTDAGLDHVEPSQVSALPLPSTATQKLALGHDTDERP